MRANETHISALAPLILQLWPDNSPAKAEEIAREYVCGKEKAAFYKEADGKIAGLAMCGLRHDYVEGCDTSPVGYLEGIVVDDAYKGRGIAKALCRECEEWAKKLGCSEFASDCELENTASLAFHLAIGFEEENRIICFRKSI
ncbi:MAG: N-acetyltransferase [Clostridiales bacterium]|jgi:Acetyltransferases|nr:N-acetyltransferase [Clostridiales bacterium]